LKFVTKTHFIEENHHKPGPCIHAGTTASGIQINIIITIIMCLMSQDKTGNKICTFLDC
jgi:hypothetical protein